MANKKETMVTLYHPINAPKGRKFTQVHADKLMKGQDTIKSGWTKINPNAVKTNAESDKGTSGEAKEQGGNK